jgi:hypothetical protein
MIRISVMSPAIAGLFFRGELLGQCFEDFCRIRALFL